MKIASVLTVTLLFLLVNPDSYSIPRFAVRLGDKCIDCHYNPTGGVVRNENGWNFGKNIMSAISPREQDFAMTPKIGNNITIGLDYRTQFLYSTEKKKSDFQQMTGSIYTNFALSDKINLLGRYDFVQRIWEAYGVMHILPNNGYLKVGSFQPNFGIRLDDHTAYTRGGDLFLLFSGGDTRQGLIYSPWYTEVGVEAGVYISDWAFLTASAGSNISSNRTFTKDPTYTARLEITPRIGRVGFLLGGSYAAAKIPQTSDFYGAFAGFGYKRFTLIGEFDRANNVITAGTKSNIVLVEAAYAITMGLDAIVRWDWLDPNIDVSSDELQHLIVGLEWFPYSFIEIRPQYRFMIEDPNANNDSFVLQFHFWY
jgi:hypothetical protein